MLKFKISKADYDKLSDELKEHYKAEGDDYIVDISGGEDTGALKRARDREIEKRKNAEQKLSDVEGELENLKGDPDKYKDIQTLEARYKSEKETEVGKIQTKYDALQNTVKSEKLANESRNLAQKLSSKHSVLLTPHIKSRLTVEFGEDEKPVVKVLDKDGKPSEMSIEDLEKEFVANKDFADIIVASKATGGAGGDKTKPNPVSSASGKETQNLSKLSAVELAAHIKAQKEAEGENE